MRLAPLHPLSLLPGDVPERTVLHSLARGVTANLGPLWFLFALLSIEILWARLQGIQVTQLGEAISVLSLPAGLGLLLNALGCLERCANSAYYLSFWLSKPILLTALGYLAAGLGFTLYDDAFAAWDLQLGFDWVGWLRYQQNHPFLLATLKLAYHSLIPQVLVAIVYFSKPSRQARARELWWTSTLALVFASLVSGVMPAMGSFEHYGLWLDRAGHLPDLHAVRDGTYHVMPLLDLTGLLTFPSFHAVAAVLLAWVYRRERRWIFGAACLLNAAMLVSTPTHGGHYLVDLIAGCTVAALAIFGVTSFFRRAKS